MKVLVVDDSGAMRKLIISYLSSLSIPMEFDEAESGEKALFQIKVKKYDAIMMDWNMPGMTGLDAVKIIRGMNIDTPIIMCTTNTEKINVIQALKAGANNYVIKPFPQEVLIEKFKDTVSRYQAGESAE